MGAKRYYNTTNNIQLIYKINMKQSDQMHQAYFFGKIPPFKRGVGWVRWISLLHITLAYDKIYIETKLLRFQEKRKMFSVTKNDQIN